LPESVQRRLRALKKLIGHQAELEAQFRAEVLALERAYLLKYQPLYEKVRDSCKLNERETDAIVTLKLLSLFLLTSQMLACLSVSTLSTVSCDQ
jgi:hypothetical protein